MAVFRPSARVRQLPENFWGAMDRDIARLSAQPGPRMIDVSKGNPDSPTPEHIVAAMQRAVADPANHRYPSYAPQPALAEAVAARYREDHGVDLDPSTQVAVCHGAHEGIVAAVLALADPGSTVVLPDPGYPAYVSAVDLAGARAVMLPLEAERAYQPAFAALDNVSDAAALVLNYPNNPTGARARRGTFEGAAAFAERTGALFIHDFAYASLGFDGCRPLSALSMDRAAEVTVEVQTLSKTYNMAGWRLGFAAGNVSAIAAMARYQSHAFSTVNAAGQVAATAALAGNQSAARDLVEVYRRRRDAVVAGLGAAGWDVATPEGSFFVWARVPGGGDAVEFAARLREQARVAVAPGDGFGLRGRGHVRVGLVHDEQTLAELVERLVAFAT